MARIVVELVSVHKNASYFQGFDKDQITIGRNLDNDVILNDPYVSEKHLTVLFQEGLIKIYDENSMNGTYLPRTKRMESDMFIQSGEEIILGRTRIRIFLETHGVSETKTLNENRRAFQVLKKKRVAWVLLIVLMVIAYLEAAAMTVDSKEVNKLLFAPIAAATAALMWAGFWGLIGRLLSHRIYFTIHISIFIIWAVVNDLCEKGREYLSFYLNSQFINLSLSYVLDSLVFVITLVITLTFVTNLARKTKIIFSSIFTVLLLIAFTGMQLSYSDSHWDYFLTDLPYDTNLKPPVLGVPQSITVEEFMENNTIVYEKVKLELNRR